MRKITITEYRKRGGFRDMMQIILSNRLATISLVIFLAGIAVFSYSRIVPYNSYNPIIQSQNGRLSNAEAYYNYSFGAAQDYQTNVSFTISDSSMLHYELYSYSIYERNQLPYPVATFIQSGNVTSGDIVPIQVLPHDQNYYILLTTYNAANVSFTVIADTVIPEHQSSNPYIGIPGLAILMGGAVLLAVSLSLGRKDR